MAGIFALAATSLTAFVAAFVLVVLYVLFESLTNVVFSPLVKVPGPKSFALNKWRLAYEDWQGTRTRTILGLHEVHGAAVRIGPREISFNSLSALKKIYGAGNGFQRTSFYSMFDAYGRQNMFSVSSNKVHRERKKLLNHAYSKTTVLSPRSSAMIEGKVGQMLRLVDSEAKDGVLEIFSSLHYFSIDTISTYLYGDSKGATTALVYSSKHRTLLNDILDPARRKLSWFTIHLPKFTKWLYGRTGVAESLVNSLGMKLMPRPATYTGIRQHALAAAEELGQSDENTPSVDSIMGRLWSLRHKSEASLDRLDIASECADHLLAGIDTTSDTTMFAIFALSQPEHHSFQGKLLAELRALQDDDVLNGVVLTGAADKLTYLDAVIKETLRLYAPLPGSEPRCSEQDEVIDGFNVPKGTVVSMSPYCLHRNPRVFRDPLRFNPERWFGPVDEVTQMKKWFWAFSSGGTMCIGMHLAMAEMTTLLASIYRKYSTEIAPGFQGVSPGVTARYEVFSDERFPKMEEHACWIKFVEV